MRVDKVVCEFCGDRFRPPFRRGPVPKYCSRSHRQRAYEQRTNLGAKRRLQAIADAWWGMTEEHQVAIGEICEGYEDDAALDVLLDTLKRTALTEEET